MIKAYFGIACDEIAIGYAMAENAAEARRKLLKIALEIMGKEEVGIDTIRAYRAELMDGDHLLLELDLWNCTPTTASAVERLINTAMLEKLEELGLYRDERFCNVPHNEL